MWLFNWLCCVIVGFVLDFKILMDPMVLSIMYVWCQLNKDTTVNFWFGTQFKAMYLPWVLFGFNMIIAGGGVMELVGILIGHLYFFLMFKYPQDFGGPSLLSTPGILYQWFPNKRGGNTGYGQAPASAQPSGVVVDREVDNKAEVEHSRDPTSGAKGNALAELLRCSSIRLMDNFLENPRLLANVH